MTFSLTQMSWHIKKDYGFDQDHPSTNLFCLQLLIHFQWNKNACRDDSDMFCFMLSDLRPPSILHCFIRYLKFWKIPFSIFIFHLCKDNTTHRIESFLMFRIHQLSVISFSVVVSLGLKKSGSKSKADKLLFHDKTTTNSWHSTLCTRRESDWKRQ